MARTAGNDLILGKLPGRDRNLGLTREQRAKHLYVCGSTGTGKSKFLENLIRQDIRDWSKSKCGLLLLDPHGNLYDNLINWLVWSEFDRPIIPIDLRQDDWVVSYNLLRQRKLADPGVLVENLIGAMAYVWGQGGTDQTPLFEQWAANVLGTLYEKNLTLVDSEQLVDRVAKQVRHALTADLKDKASQSDWQLANTLSPKDFESQIGSTVRRFRRFLRTQAMRNMFGLPDVSLDLGKALEDGAIILVNLATERARISKENSELFATLLLSDLWTAAQERGKRDNVKPFYVYLDEFQRFITPTISENLDEARGYGLHLTVAHQFPNQLLDRGENGKRVYNSIMENASSKVVFRLSHDENLRAMAQWLFMGVMNPDEIKHELYSTKVMGYCEEYRTAYGESSSTGRGAGSQSGHASGAGIGGTNVFDDENRAMTTSESSSSFSSDSFSESASWSETETESRTDVPMLIPILGKELSHVQFRSLDEQLHRAMAVLFDQKERQGVARLVGMHAPVSIYTPEVSKRPGNEKRTKRFLEKCYKKLPFALPTKDAVKQVSDRSAHFAETLFKETSDEPATAKRKIR
ncbi:MAG: type IV secretion system DNA-binding domain-containing protein [Acidobacteriota bacterium]|nr:type IV secretion system DNA-binding domain-containing protein [Acidobacteriota bacterium]